MAGNPWPNQSIWREWHRLHLPICTYMKWVSPAISKKEIYPHCLASVKHNTQHALCQQLEPEQLDMFSYATASYTHIIRSYCRIVYLEIRNTITHMFLMWYLIFSQWCCWGLGIVKLCQLENSYEHFESVMILQNVSNYLPVNKA